MPPLNLVFHMLKKPSDKTENKNELSYPFKHQLLAKLRQIQEGQEDYSKQQPLSPSDMLIPTVCPSQLSFLQKPASLMPFLSTLERVSLLQAHRTLLIKWNILLREGNGTVEFRKLLKFSKDLCLEKCKNKTLVERLFAKKFLRLKKDVFGLKGRCLENPKHNQNSPVLFLSQIKRLSQKTAGIQRREWGSNEKGPVHHRGKIN